MLSEENSEGPSVFRVFETEGVTSMISDGSAGYRSQPVKVTVPRHCPRCRSSRLGYYTWGIVCKKCGFTHDV